MLTDECEIFGDSSISNAELEYLELPQYGAEHFNLEDISLLAALDDWWMKNGEDDPDFDELVANKEARAESAPLQKKIVKALTRAVIEGDLKAVVFAKELASGDPIARRTYSHITDIKKHLNLYGYGNGHLMEVAEGLDEEVYDLALSVYRKRACIELGVIPSRNEVSNMPLHELLPEMHNAIDSKSLEIAHLKGKLNGQKSDKPLATSERKAYLNIIAAMLELLKNPRPGRVDDAAIIRELVGNYGDKYGISESNLNRKLPEAKRILNAD